MLFNKNVVFWVISNKESKNLVGMKAATEYRISSGKSLELNQVVAIFFFPPKLEVLYPEE